MSEQRAEPNLRILVIDDNVQIHCDIAKILGCLPPGGAEAAAAPATKDRANELSRMKAALFGKPVAAAAPCADTPGTELPPTETPVAYTLDFASQGEEGVAKVREALAAGKPYAMAFVDMRMPPGWDGLRTVRELWAVDSNVNIVICTAFSDSSWSEVDALAAGTDRLLVLTKPFEPIEVRRLAATMTTKWSATVESVHRMGQLRDLVAQRTAQLEAARQARPTEDGRARADRPHPHRRASARRDARRPDPIAEPRALPRSAGAGARLFEQAARTPDRGDVHRL